MATTFQTIQSDDTKETAKFLRKVIRDNSGSSCGAWGIRISSATEWRLRFERTIRGAVGEPDQRIEVQTDFAVRMPSDREYGTKQAMDDYTPVFVSRPSYAFLHDTEAAIVAKMLLDGASVSIHVSSGSAHSSRLGLSFYWLECSVPSIPHGAVTVGGKTIAVDGKTLTCGVVSIS